MSADQTPSSANLASKIILGVDDVAENLFLLKATTRRAGYTFMGATSGRECLSLLLRVTPRVILLDIEMPEMDGFETCRRIKENPDFRHIPVLFLTARKTSEDVKKCVMLGGNDFIAKPFDVEKLLERVRHWSSRRATGSIANEMRAFGR
jgi:two-component system sensor histidine kinase/response regulator